MSRILLGADTTFYASPAALDDTGDGLSSITPKKHAQAVIDMLYQSYDFGGRNVTLQMIGGQGTFNEHLSLRGKFVGQLDPESFTILGDKTTPGNCLLASTGFPAIEALYNAACRVTGLAIQSDTGGFSTARSSDLHFDFVEFRNCGAYHMHAGPHSSLRGFDNYSVTGSAGNHVNAARGQWQLNTTGPNGISTPYATLTGHLTFDYFMSVIEQALIDAAGGPGIFYVPVSGANSVSYSGGQYNIGGYSEIYLGGYGASVLPPGGTPRTDGNGMIV